jgi:hypothetical protein
MFKKFTTADKLLFVVALFSIILFIDYRLYDIIKGQFEFYYPEYHNDISLFGGIYSQIDRLLISAIFLTISSLIVFYKYQKLIEKRILFLARIYNISNLIITLIIFILCEYYEPFNFGFG